MRAFALIGLVSLSTLSACGGHECPSEPGAFGLCEYGQCPDGPACDNGQRCEYNQPVGYVVFQCGCRGDSHWYYTMTGGDPCAGDGWPDDMSMSTLVIVGAGESCINRSQAPLQFANCSLDLTCCFLCATDPVGYCSASGLCGMCESQLDLAGPAVTDGGGSD
jgi:hypothetical protein